ELALGRTVGVVEGRSRRAAFRDRPQIPDRQRRGEPAPARVQIGLLELHQLEQFTGVGKLSLDGWKCLPDVGASDQLVRPVPRTPLLSDTWGQAQVGTGGASRQEGRSQVRT